MEDCQYQFSSLRYPWVLYEVFIGNAQSNNTYLLRMRLDCKLKMRCHESKSIPSIVFQAKFINILKGKKNEFE